MEGMQTFESAISIALGSRDPRSGTLSARLLQCAGVPECGRDEDVSRLSAGFQIGLYKKYEMKATYRDCIKLFRSFRRRINEPIYLRLCSIFGGGTAFRFSSSRLFALPVIPLCAIILFLSGGKKCAKRLLQIENTPKHVLDTTLDVAKRLNSGIIECVLVNGLRALCELLGDDGGTNVKELFDCSSDVIELAITGLLREIHTLSLRPARIECEMDVDENDFLVFFFLCSFLSGSAFDNEVRRFAGMNCRVSIWKKIQIPKIPYLPSLHWIDHKFIGNAHWHIDNKLIMEARSRTDWFINPNGLSNLSNAPVLAFEFDNDSRLSARLHCHFNSSFDAAALFVHQGDSHYAKLCLQRTTNSQAAIVSVVTKGMSDESIGPIVHSTHVHLQLSRSGSVLAFHYSINQTQWHLLRLFCLVDDAPTWAGFMAQAPLGDGCTVEFDRIHFSQGNQPNPRDFIQFTEP